MTVIEIITIIICAYLFNTIIGIKDRQDRWIDSRVVSIISFIIPIHCIRYFVAAIAITLIASCWLWIPYIVYQGVGLFF